MQTDRPVSVSSPLGPDELLFYRMNAKESLGRLFDFDLDVLSEDHNINLEDLLGQSLTVSLDLSGGGTRYFNGIVSQLSFVGTVGRYAQYSLQLHPGLWLLTRSADCRIFQSMTLPDIIKEVLGEFGFSDIEDSLSGSYEAWDYCVQYRETAFNFISRLMEKEGIYYYFKHEDGKHILVLSDSYSSHEAVSGFEEIPFFPPEEGKESDLDRFLDWRISQQVQTTSFTLDDYDFEAPKSDLQTNAEVDKKHSGTDYKVFDYPGEYPDTAVGSDYVKYRIEELKAGYETYAASGTVRGLMAGSLFSLSDHPRDDQNKEYLVVSAIHALSAGGYESGDVGSGQLTYVGSIEAIDAQVPFRSPRATRKPAVQGPQTAVVVGPSGEDVWTDKYGRVKVQFHWDRVGANDENSSCWVRVSQNWAGKNWGGMFIPHVGHEVIVDFLEGDPDRPIITGRVYNGDNMPPLPLPGNKHQSIIRDHFGNEIEFDGTPGNEHLSLYSPSKNSILQLGKCVRCSADQETKLIIGNSFSYSCGVKHGVHIGDKTFKTRGSSSSITTGDVRSHTEGISIATKFGFDFSAFAGQKASVTIGGDVSIVAAWKFTAGLSRDFKWVKGDYNRTSKSNITLDSAEKVIIAGGADDQSMLHATEDHLSISFGASGRTASDPDIIGATLAATAGAVAAAAAFSSVVQSEDLQAEIKSMATEANKVEGKAEHEITHDVERLVEQAEHKMLDDSTVVSSTLLGLGGALAATLLEPKPVPPESQVSTSQVLLKEDKVIILAGDISGENATSKITISKDGGIELESTKDIVMKSDVGIFYSTPENVEISAAKQIKLKKGKVDHPNFTALP